MNINWRCLGYAILGASGVMGSIALWGYVLFLMPGPLTMAAWGLVPSAVLITFAFYNLCVSRTRSSRP